MIYLIGLACVVTLSGIGIIFSGSLVDLGIILLIEGGVLVTLIKEARK
jgi:hypothetical protein